MSYPGVVRGNLVSLGDRLLWGMSQYGSNPDATRIEKKHLNAAALGRPNAQPPDIVIQDNVEFLAFTVNTDRVFYDWDIPEDYDSGDLNIQVEWTNDGGADDNGLEAKVQIDYQTYAEGDVLSGSHANSPKSIEDTYTSATGWIFHITGAMTIAAADFAGKHGVSMKISFVTPTGGALTAEPHLKGIQILYLAKINS